MLWSPVRAAVAFASSATTLLAAYQLWRDKPPRDSTAYWLIGMLCRYYSAFALARAAFFTWLTVVVIHGPGGEAEYVKMDQLGIHAVAMLVDKQSWFATMTLVAGDIAVCAVFLWLFQLTRQVSRLLSRGMDEGEEREREKIRRIAILNHIGIAVILASELSIVLCFGGYSRALHCFLLGMFGLQAATTMYMIVVAVYVKFKGRDLDTARGERVVAPIYRRLQWILLAFAAGASQFQILSLTLLIRDRYNFASARWMGISSVIYNATGIVLALAVGCSRQCTLRICTLLARQPIEQNENLLDSAPSHFQQLESHEQQADVSQSSNRSTVETPSQHRLAQVRHPVFVYTDIESSSALWAIDDGRIMQEATELHDALIRELVAKLGGYEIATAGDAFHLAFSSVPRAVLFCLTVQLRLMSVRWPRQLYGLVPATRTVRCGLRTVFRGLRVRMGVHCYDEEDGPLLRSIHAVTRTVTYAGESVAIASAIVELAAGGQILVTSPIASCLPDLQSVVPVPFVMDDAQATYVDSIHSCHMSRWELFQVFPQRLSRRRELMAKAGSDAADAPQSFVRSC